MKKQKTQKNEKIEKSKKKQQFFYFSITYQMYKIEKYLTINLDQTMETYKIGEYVYNTTNPNNSGTITEIHNETYLVKTETGDEEWFPKTFSRDYHQIIKNLLEDLNDMKESWFRQKDEITLLKSNK